MTTIHFYENDLPNHIKFEKSVAIDTETLGLNPIRDRLCLVQIATEQGEVHLIHFKDVDICTKATNLKSLLENSNIEKIFHFGLFDIGVLKHYVGATITNVFCTKIASKIARTYTQRHGLKDLCKNLLSISLEKEEQTSNWGAKNLSQSQKNYAAQDVIHLHALRDILKNLLKETKRESIAYSCFQFLPTKADLHLLGWTDDFIFQH